MVFLKEFFEKVNFLKNQQTTKRHNFLKISRRQKGIKNYPVCNELNYYVEGPRSGTIIQGRGGGIRVPHTTNSKGLRWDLSFKSNQVWRISGS